MSETGSRRGSASSASTVRIAYDDVDVSSADQPLSYEKQAIQLEVLEAEHVTALAKLERASLSMTAMHQEADTLDAAIKAAGGRRSKVAVTEAADSYLQRRFIAKSLSMIDGFHFVDVNHRLTIAKQQAATFAKTQQPTRPPPTAEDILAEVPPDGVSADYIYALFQPQFDDFEAFLDIMSLTTMLNEATNMLFPRNEALMAAYGGHSPNDTEPSGRLQHRPTLAELRAAIPDRGISDCRLLGLFVGRCDVVGDVFCAMVDQVATHDPVTGLLHPRRDHDAVWVVERPACTQDTQSSAWTASISSARSQLGVFAAPDGNEEGRWQAWYAATAGYLGRGVVRSSFTQTRE